MTHLIRYKRKAPTPVSVYVPKTAMYNLMKVQEETVMVSISSSTSFPTVGNATSIGDGQSLSIVDLSNILSNLPALPNQTGAGYSAYAMITGAEHEAVFTSNDMTGMSIKYWIVMAKRANAVAAYSPTNTWKAGVENSNYGNVPAAPSTAGGFYNPASHPNDSVLFKEYWTVLADGEFRLLPGRTQKIKYCSPNVPFVFNAGISQSNYTLKGVTMAILYQATGDPVLLNSGGPTTATHNPPTFLVMHKRRFRIKHAIQFGIQLKYNIVGNQNIVDPDELNFVNPTSGLPYGNYNSARVVNTGNAQLSVNGGGAGAGTPDGAAIPVQGTGSLSKTYALDTRPLS